VSEVATVVQEDVEEGGIGGGAGDAAATGGVARADLWEADAEGGIGGKGIGRTLWSP